ncbi:dynactin p62 family-domain-containing protein [Flagelloscypha sp. PMI_526]|nr:dynactin p62 family-domain-containing protein [Flagelloscypha sp. PMI_526]
MAPTILYHCPCLSNSPVPPPPHLPSSAASFHALHTLYFCHECNAIRCNRCVSVEVSGYYCPNCLFEVPSASVRAEKNRRVLYSVMLIVRCARNCFMCPHCMNTLSIVPSDPHDPGDGRPVVISTIGEPPFFLFCNHCRWDSAQVGITFEKPTGLAAQLQRFEDSAPDTLEFERLKEHFEPILRATVHGPGSLAASAIGGPPPSHHGHTRTNSITAAANAANAALARDVPGVGKYNPLASSTRSIGSTNKDRTPNRDEMPEYRARIDSAAGSSRGGGGGEVDVEFLRGLESIDEVATLEQRWTNSWTSPLQSRDLKPLRIPLHSKRSKRCPTCTRILIKPEQKAQSVRFKIKLAAANEMPAIRVALPHQQTAQAAGDLKRSMNRSTTTAANPEDDPLHGAMLAGQTYPFHLALSNPLWDQTTVRLSVQRVHVGGDEAKARRPPFAISLPTSSFTIDPYQEAWEYDDDDEDYLGMDDDELGIGGGTGKPKRERKDSAKTTKHKTVGVLEKKQNSTVVGGEVVIGKEAKGTVKFNMLVSFTYRVDEAPLDESEPVARMPTKGEEKTFAFYTVVDLGPIIPKEESSRLRPEGST